MQKKAVAEGDPVCFFHFLMWGVWELVSLMFYLGARAALHSHQYGNPDRGWDSRSSMASVTLACANSFFGGGIFQNIRVLGDSPHVTPTGRPKDLPFV